MGEFIMGNLLFSPSGRIGPKAFLKGAIILGVVGALLALTGYINALLFSFAIMIYFLLAIPYILMGIKRAHDAGKTGWFSLLFLLILGAIYMGIGFLLSAIGLAPSAAEQAAGQERLKEVQGSSDITEMMAVLNEVMAPMIIPMLLTMLLTPIISAFLVNLFMKSDQHDNMYGPATTGDS